MPPDKLYRLTAACLLTHELEAVLLHDNPVLASPGMLLAPLGLFAHLPAVIGLLVIAELTRSAAVRYGVCVFAVVHVALHWIQRDQMAHDSSAIIAWMLILLAGIFGAAYLVPQKAR